MTLGPRVAEVARRLGTPLMPWQREVVDVALEVDEDGHLAYREVVVTVPRQSGKTRLGLAVKVHRAIGFADEPQNILYTAQTGTAARKKWEDDQVKALDACRSLKGKYRVRRQNGREAILWANGSRHGLGAPTRTAAHGETLDLGFIDEAFAHKTDEVEQAMAPAMITRPDAQLWVVSTAGDADSAYLYRKILAGRAASEAGEHGRVAYFEWSAEDGAEPGDPATWASCSPALGHTISKAVLATEWERALRKGAEGINLFRRSYLNQWVETPSLTDAIRSIIPAEAWRACSAPGSTPGEPLAFAFDVTPERDHAAIAVAGGDHVEVVDHHRGTDWVVPRLVELVGRWRPERVVVDPRSPAGALIGELEAAGVEVTKASTQDVTHACGGLFDAVKAGRVRHLDQPSLNRAVEGAAQRTVGDAWAWARRTSAVDISPLVAVTLARWGAKQETAASGYLSLADL